MTPTTALGSSRRQFLKSTGAVIVTFAWPTSLGAQPARETSAAGVDAWLAIAADGAITLFTGKVEIGTGVSTALAQIVAEELDARVERVGVIQGDTERTPNQGYTAGSKTIQQGGPPIRQAAAEARRTLLGLAAARLGVTPEQLTVDDGVVALRGDAARRVTYAELIGGRRFERAVSAPATTKRPSEYRVVGTSVARVDIPGKVTGAPSYVHDLRLPGMLHARVVRPPAVGATVESIDESSVRDVPGHVRVVREGNFIGVVAEREEQAIRAAQALKVTWHESATLPDIADLHREIRAARTTDKTVSSRGDTTAGFASAARTVAATYEWPFQMHASMGPSCSVADVTDERATIWCSSQGVFGLRGSLAKLLNRPAERIHLVFAEGAGCYGHNGADDVAADAALLSRAVGRPVRVQWMRHDEHAWEPKGPAMVMQARGAVDGNGRAVAWEYEVWSPTHSTRPRGDAGETLAGQLQGLPIKVPFIGGDRNARHGYEIDNERVVIHWLADMPLRVSALRGLGAPQNTFANESFIDELAAVAGADPVDFRLRHLRDQRAIDVVRAAASLASWQPRIGAAARAENPIARGRGFAYAQYENENAYVATVADVEVDRRTGAIRVRRVFVAHDCGLIVNPDGVRNQIEGNVVQTISRTLKEEVRFDRRRVTSLDWQSYPLLRFSEVPDAIEITLIDRRDQPSVGAGEPAACPVPAAIANAVFAAIGVRLRRVPFTPERVKGALHT
ncbi:MAG: xanthine dehydrogenase family protein molybdopterin-binding subunit [Candidatus Rokuibacteriota bacterium]|nr:MAG: xanthine dehydrogenase family protein molybdopterin-binding subunit [Candidatus Rokubacteria bacterium]